MNNRLSMFQTPGSIDISAMILFPFNFADCLNISRSQGKFYKRDCMLP